MAKYKDFIPQNVAPKNTVSIGVYNGDERVGTIPLGFLSPPKKSKLYSFEALSDIHITYDTAVTDFERALKYLDNSDCLFAIISGDLGGNGARTELEEFMRLVGNRNVHFMPGNHENYSTKSYAYYEEVTGRPFYYSFEQGNDVFIMVGHYGGYQGDGIGWLASEFVSVEELQWLYETLETNRNKRCFVFSHVFPYDDGVGDANRLYGAANWRTKDGGVGQAYIDLLKHYKNTVLFHGHSHLMLYLQEIDKKANYADSIGYRSVHIPSLAVPRDLPEPSQTHYSEVFAESEGYIVDVYDDYIILNGRDFIDNDADGHIIPIGTYKIDTKLVNIPAGTFTDSTGIITT